jgi:hypothetical protein
MAHQLQLSQFLISHRRFNFRSGSRRQVKRREVESEAVTFECAASGEQWSERSSIPTTES